jgi:hypothetical protein
MGIDLVSADLTYYERTYALSLECDPEPFKVVTEYTRAKREELPRVCDFNGLVIVEFWENQCGVISIPLNEIHGRIRSSPVEQEVACTIDGNYSLSHPYDDIVRTIAHARAYVASTPNEDTPKTALEVLDEFRTTLNSLTSGSTAYKAFNIKIAELQKDLNND